jgi:hypothetical protein
MEYDGAIIIAGAGAAGISAAVSCARNGFNVLLIEKLSRLGGTVTHSLIHSLGGLYDSDGNLINNGLTAELEDRLYKISPFTHKRKIGRVWTLNCDPDDYEYLINQWISEETRIKVFVNSLISSVIINKNNVASITIKSYNNSISLRPGALIDSTGCAEIIRMIDPHLVNDEDDKAAAGLIFVLQGLSPDILKFPNNISIKQKINHAANSGILPEECSMLWIDRGVREDEAYIKLQVTLGNCRNHNETKRAEQKAIDVRNRVLSFLTEIPGFSKASLFKTGKLGIRDCGTTRGEYILTESDVRDLRKFEDTACRCCWPIEYWNQQTGVNVEYLPDHTYYEIPLRSLRIKEVKNLWVIGKCLSADKKAQASSRVVGSCWAMGDALGKALSEKLNEGDII